MFVYNNCTNDPRVLKEARSLIAAGHSVQIVAVLDKTTTVEELRDGISIVRIARDPPHYKLLRLSRRIRRRIRLRWARIRRSTRRIRARAQRRAQLPITAVARGSARASRAITGTLQRAETGAAGARRHLRDGVTQVRERQLTAQATADPVLPTRGDGSALLRPYRAVRWRILRRSTFANRLYYTRRTRKKRRRIQRAKRAAAHLEVLRNPTPTAQIAIAAPNPKPITKPAVAAKPVDTRTSGPVSRTARRIERRISHVCYRAVMLFHRPLMHIDYYVRAYKLVRSQEFDVFHAHDLNTLPAAVALARRTRTKLVYDAHELYPEISTLSRTERNFWKVAERHLIKRAAHVITVCDSIAGELEQRYKVAQPTVLLNCPDSRASTAPGDRERLRRALSMEDDPRPIVLYQGGFAPNRGLPELIKAGRWLDGARIALMGMGRLEEELRTLILEERVGDTVVLTPAVPQSEVIAFAAGADVGVIPYKGVGLNNYYTTPNKLFDYMAAGIAIAGSRFPEIVRFVEGLGIGVTFNPDDPRDIAYTLNYLLSDPDALKGMRTRAAAASSEFVWDSEQRKLLEIYSQVAATHRTPAAAA